LRLPFDQIIMAARLIIFPAFILVVPPTQRGRVGRSYIKSANLSFFKKWTIPFIQISCRISKWFNMRSGLFSTSEIPNGIQSHSPGNMEIQLLHSGHDAGTSRIVPFWNT